MRYPIGARLINTDYERGSRDGRIHYLVLVEYNAYNEANFRRDDGILTGFMNVEEFKMIPGGIWRLEVKENLFDQLYLRML